MSEPFRWQALLQRVTEPVFLLDRQRRIRFVNAAWEALTGLSAAEAHGLVCRRRRDWQPGSTEAIGHALAPPPEVLAGRSARMRRLIAGGEAPRLWWDVDFFPLRDAQGVCAVLGKVAEIRSASEAETPLPEKLITLQERLARRYTFDSLAGNSPGQRCIAAQVRLGSQTRIPVLLIGEPGTGKEWTARVIHHQGLAQTFAALDCARLPVAALESALFDPVGLVYRKSVGTLYLKEIASLPREHQTRLADRLADPNDTAGPRIIAGLSADPAEEVQAGRLLGDLFTALSTLVLRLPPLRERLADLPIVVARLLERVNAEAGPGGRHITGLSPDTWKIVREYRWPSNLRELAAALTTARDHAARELIEGSDLPAYVRQAVRLDEEPGQQAERSLPLTDLMQQVERRLILLALEMAKGNKSRAAEILALGRGGLLSRLKSLGIADKE